MGSQAGQKQAAGKEDTSWLESHSVFAQRACKQAFNRSFPATPGHTISIKTLE